MQVILDGEQWEVDGNASLGEILAHVNDRAQANDRLVTGLAIDGHPVTDRDLTPALLARSAADVATVRAASCTMRELAATARTSLKQFAELLKSEGAALAMDLRAGRDDLAPLDLWLGKLADYVELAEVVYRQWPEGETSTSMAAPLARVIDARATHDTVRLADVLEFELLPCLERHD
jgi:hypothetical protein